MCISVHCIFMVLVDVFSDFTGFEVESCNFNFYAVKESLKIRNVLFFCRKCSYHKPV